jgi:hypothetical protein
MASKPDHYQTLGISPTASKKDIKTAYRSLAKALHPDRNPGDKGAEQRFKFVGEAYDILKDDKRRARYNALHGTPKAAGDAVHPTSQTVWPDLHPQPTHARAQPASMEFSLFADPEAARFLLAIILAICAVIFLGHHAVFTAGFWFAVGFLAIVGFFFRDDATYFISIAAPRHLVYAWSGVLLIVFAMAYSEAHTAHFKNDASFIVAPFRLVFYLYFLIAHTAWHWLLITGLVAWFVTLFITSVRLSGFILFSVLFLITLLVRYDTTLMIDFARYYDSLFSIEKPVSL